MHPVAGDEDGAAAFGKLVGDVELLERTDDGAAITLGKVGEKDAEVAVLGPQNGADEYGDDGSDGKHQCQFLLVIEAGQGDAGATECAGRGFAACCGVR